MQLLLAQNGNSGRTRLRKSVSTEMPFPTTLPVVGLAKVVDASRAIACRLSKSAGTFINTAARLAYP